VTTNDMIIDEVRGNRGELLELHKQGASHEERLKAIESHIGAGSALKRGLVMTAISSATALAIFHAGRIVPLIPTP